MGDFEKREPGFLDAEYLLITNPNLNITIWAPDKPKLMTSNSPHRWGSKLNCILDIDATLIGLDMGLPLRGLTVDPIYGVTGNLFPQWGGHPSTQHIVKFGKPRVGFFNSG